MEGLITVISSSPTSQAPEWLQYASALVPIVISMMVAYIAYRQWKTTQEKLKLDLFERRVEIFDDFRELQIECTKAYYEPEKPFIPSPEREGYAETFRHSRWLFNDAVASALAKAGNAYFEFISVHGEFEQNAPRGSELSDEGRASRDNALLSVYVSFDSAAKQVIDLMEPHLRLSH